MSEIKFSLLIPSRARYDMVQALIISIDRTVADPGSIELLFGCDEDDYDSIHNIENFKQHVPKLNIIVHTRERSEWLNRDYYTWLAGLAKGKYLWVLGNDLIFHTLQWDTLLEKFIEDRMVVIPDRIFCIGVDDGTPKPAPHLPDFPCFPLISREAFQVLGFALHSEVPTWGADFLLYCVYSAVERLFYMKQIVLEHISYHTRKVPVDAVNRRIGEIYAKNKPAHTYCLEQVVPRNIETLKTYIEKKRIERIIPNV